MGLAAPCRAPVVQHRRDDLRHGLADHIGRMPFVVVGDGFHQGSCRRQLGERGHVLRHRAVQGRPRRPQQVEASHVDCPVGGRELLRLKICVGEFDYRGSGLGLCAVQVGEPSPDTLLAEAIGDGELVVLLPAGVDGREMDLRLLAPWADGQLELIALEGKGGQLRFRARSCP